MELDFNKIIRLKKIRIEKSELSEEENALTTPILKDKSLIHEIYKIFVELLNEKMCIRDRIKTGMERSRLVEPTLFPSSYRMFR